MKFLLAYCDIIFEDYFWEFIVISKQYPLNDDYLNSQYLSAWKCTYRVWENNWMLKILLILLANESTARFVRRNEQLNQCSKEIQKEVRVLLKLSLSTVSLFR